MRDSADAEESASCVDGMQAVEGGHIEVGGGGAGEVGDLVLESLSEVVQEERKTGQGHR